jgi:uncharacterized membrane protein
MGVASLKRALLVKPESNLPVEISNAHEQLGLERMIFFTDAVFAIAITLLALDIQLPKTTGELSNSQLFTSLLAIWPKYLSYILSFLVIGFFWMAHHRKFRLIVRYDKTLLYLNHILLMVVAFVPFATSVISEYGNQTATILYGLTIAGMGLALAGIWYYASKNHRLIDPKVQQQQIRLELVRVLTISVIFLLSIGITWIDDDLAKFSWILVGFAQTYFEGKSRQFKEFQKT